MSRKAMPIGLAIIDNSRRHLTKATIEARQQNEPKPTSFKLKPPEWVSDVARSEWRRIVKLYKDMDAKIISDLDYNALAVYCEAFSTYKKATEKMQAQAEVYATKTDPGKAIVNPWVRVARDASDTMLKYGSVLMLDPAARAKIGLAKAENAPESPLAALMRKRVEEG